MKMGDDNEEGGNSGPTLGLEQKGKQSALVDLCAAFYFCLTVF